MFPPLPTWETVHPMLVHLPLGLLFIAPLLVIAGLFISRAQTGVVLSALALMVLGTGGLWLAVASGEAGEDMAERIPAAKAVLERHEDLAELTRNIFTILTPIYAIIVVAQLAVKNSLPRWTTAAVTVLFLGIYGGSLVVLANAGHEGARLVHEFGVHAMQPAASASEVVRKSHHD